MKYEAGCIELAFHLYNEEPHIFNSCPETNTVGAPSHQHIFTRLQNLYIAKTCRYKLWITEGFELIELCFKKQLDVEGSSYI